MAIEILYCGVCHSDIHQTRDEWGGAKFPMVPGHEITGRVTAVGAEVKKFKPGDLAGVGVLVDSCRQCTQCRAGMEMFCEKGAVETYNSRDYAGAITYGGYSKAIVVDEAFVLKIRHPEQQLAAVAPMLCAGITTYSPLRHWGAGPGKKVGIVGLGGLGHVGLKLAHALGAEVVQYTTSKNKIEDAKRLGADEVVLLNDAAAMKKHRGSLDFMLDTAAANHDLAGLLMQLKVDATMALVGLPSTPYQFGPGPLIGGRRSLAGSAIGGLAETQEMLDFCAERKVVSDIEMTPIQKINEAYERVVRGDVKYRFVIDMASL